MRFTLDTSEHSFTRSEVGGIAEYARLGLRFRVIMGVRPEHNLYTVRNRPVIEVSTLEDLLTIQKHVACPIIISGDNGDNTLEIYDSYRE